MTEYICPSCRREISKLGCKICYTHYGKIGIDVAVDGRKMADENYIEKMVRKDDDEDNAFFCVKCGYTFGRSFNDAVKRFIKVEEKNGEV